MATECIEEPIPVFEVMTELNTRSTFGRIVINPPSRMATLKVHKTGEAWYFCEECGRGFLHREKMLQHKEEHKIAAKAAKLQAAIKKKKGSSNSSKLASSFKKGKSFSHSRVKGDYSGCIKTENGEYQCRSCPKVFRRSSNYFLHVMRHKNVRPHKCLQCGAGFNCRSYLKFHIKRSHSLLHNFRCTHCTCRFETQLGLRRHCEMYHEGNAFLSQNTEAVALTARSPTPIKMMPSPHRGFKHEVNSQEEARMENHGSNFVKFKADFFSRISNAVVKNSIKALGSNRWKSKNKAPQNFVAGPPFECNICHKILARASTFKDHLLIHTGERPYLCKHCGMRFRLYSTLANHIKCAHFGGGNCRCPYCDCAYKTNSVLSRHIKRAHEQF